MWVNWVLFLRIKTHRWEIPWHSDSSASTRCNCMLLLRCVGKSIALINNISTQQLPTRLQLLEKFSSINDENLCEFIDKIFHVRDDSLIAYQCADEKTINLSSDVLFWRFMQLTITDCIEPWSRNVRVSTWTLTSSQRPCAHSGKRQWAWRTAGGGLFRGTAITEEKKLFR